MRCWPKCCAWMTWRSCTTAMPRSRFTAHTGCRGRTPRGTCCFRSPRAPTIRSQAGGIKCWVRSDCSFRRRHRPSPAMSPRRWGRHSPSALRARWASMAPCWPRMGWCCAASAMPARTIRPRWGRSIPRAGRRSRARRCRSFSCARTMASAFPRARRRGGSRRTFPRALGCITWRATGPI